MKIYTREEIREKLAQYHNIDGSKKLTGTEGVSQIMERLGSIQYDPLNVAGRNADLVLQARVEDYRPEYLYTLLYKEHRLLDGFDKEMCIYNTKDFSRFARVREEHTKAVETTLRYRGQLETLSILEEVQSFVKEHGLTGTKDISIGEVRESRWGHKKLSSAALDYLYNKGELCVADKRGTQKYFDMTQRVVQVGLCEADEMSPEEFLDWYVARRIKSLGCVWDKNGGAWQGHFLSDKEIRKTVLQRLLDQKSITAFSIEGIDDIFYADEDFFGGSSGRIREDYVRFMAPLDNMLWDRTMVERIFDFAYRWEVYTPVAKRKYGYYVLPVIYNDRFVARFEPEPVSQAGCFCIKNWWWEKDVSKEERLYTAIMKEMHRFSEYLGVECAEENRRKIG